MPCSVGGFVNIPFIKGNVYRPSNSTRNCKGQYNEDIYDTLDTLVINYIKFNDISIIYSDCGSDVIYF